MGNTHSAEAVEVLVIRVRRWMDKVDFRIWGALVILIAPSSRPVDEAV